MPAVLARSFAIMKQFGYLVMLCMVAMGFSSARPTIGDTMVPEKDSIPALNRSVVDFVQAHVGKKVGAGECWDLAAEALNNAGAHWDGLYGFGELVDWKRVELFPGDIVQMENVEVEHREGNMIHRERYGHHTAVIHTVHARGEYTLAHQNVDPVGRKVGLSAFALRDVRGGKLLFYRPR